MLGPSGVLKLDRLDKIDENFVIVVSQSCVEGRRDNAQEYDEIKDVLPGHLVVMPKADLTNEI